MKKYFLVYPRVFYPAIITIVLFITIVIVGGSAVEEFFKNIHRTVTKYTSWLFIVGVNLFVLASLWIAFGKYGRYKLGGENTKPEFSLVSWLSMLFSAGLGIGLLYYGVFEPISHYANPPMETFSESQKAIQSLTFTYLHWGVHGWAIYCVLGLALGYYTYNKKLPFSIRSIFFPLLGKKIYSIYGDMIDIIAVVATLFGVATSLGIGSTQLATGINYVFGIQAGIESQIVIIAFITLIATISVVTGLKKGILFLSQLNIILATLFLIIILFLSDTFGIIRIFIESSGMYFQRFIELSTWSSAFINPQWQNQWSIFYYAWWVAWAPFVGMFIARISKGRSLREFVFGVIAVPVFLSFFWFSTLGGSALLLEMETPGIISTDVLNDSSTAMFVFLKQFPWSIITSLMALIVVAIFFITSSDSGSLVIDSISTGGKLNPPIGQRILWAVTEGLVAIALLIGGGLSAMQAVNVSSGILFLLILFLVTYSLIRSVRRIHIEVSRKSQRVKKASTDF
ncbi:MAG: BCCT family transporter [Flavobacteriaceae bacterium]|nr:BCCT family transporter [Flavobacteriaceae bacterium]MCY4268052.1 BCCT family transporter [Flavobacteriaceae bacterium]